MHTNFERKVDQTKLDHEGRMDQIMKKVRISSDEIDKHHKMHEDIKAFREMITKHNDKIEQRIARNKTAAQDELAKLKEENQVRFDDIEKVQQDYSEHNALKHNESKNNLLTQVKQVKEDVMAHFKTDIEHLKEFVTGETGKVNQNNDSIYEKYDAKLKKIKDVCAQYFSKYEKHLINHQTIVKDLERQQEQWSTMLLKPQELNQARLFAIETRIKEGESSKLNEVDFLKETTKKLIFAIEQA